MTLIDLSRDIYHKMPRLLNHPSIVITPYSTHDEVRVADGYEFSSATMALALGDHAGTHVDAPSHYFKEGDSSEKIDLSKLIGPAAVVDVRHLDGEAENGASPAITVAHLEAWEAEHGRFEPGEIALLLTGWSKHYVKGEAGRAFLHEPVVLQSRPAWPAPEAAAAIFLHERGVNAIGIDAPSMGSAEEGNEVHRAGLSRAMAFIEGLTNLDQLPPRGASFVFLPIKIAVASGAPGRAIALLP